MPEAYCYPHPRPAVTVDIVLLSSDGAVLLVRRNAEPFQGRWALPGGFVEMDERLADAAARELQEEAGVGGVALRELGVFDDPGRDPRGRTISIAFVGRVAGRPALRSGTDAAAASWRALDDLPALAFDHDQIVRSALETT